MKRPSKCSRGKMEGLNTGSHHVGAGFLPTAAMYPQIEFFSVGLATVIDAVLLAALFERRNRSRVAVPIVALIVGATMLHGGAFVRLLLFDFVGAWARQILWSALLVTTIGLLLIPSAMTHCCWRLLRT